MPKISVPTRGPALGLLTSLTAVLAASALSACGLTDPRDYGAETTGGDVAVTGLGFDPPQPVVAVGNALGLTLYTEYDDFSREPVDGIYTVTAVRASFRTRSQLLPPGFADGLTEPIAIGGNLSNLLSVTVDEDGAATLRALSTKVRRTGDTFTAAGANETGDDITELRYLIVGIQAQLGNRLSRTSSVLITRDGLESLSVAPDPVNTRVGEGVQLRVEGVYGNEAGGLRVDLTSAATGLIFTMEDPGVAAITDSGRVEGLSVGNTRLGISYPRGTGVSSASQFITKVVAVNVDEAVIRPPLVVTGISIDPADQVVTVGDNGTYKVLATVQDVTGPKVVEITDNPTLTVTADPADALDLLANGSFEALRNPGRKVTLRAALPRDDDPGNTNPFTATATVEVLSPDNGFVSLRLDPAAFNLRPLDTRTVKLLGRTALGTEVDLTGTAGVVFFSDDSSTVRFEQGGKVTALRGPGGRVVRIGATFDNLVAVAQVTIQGDTTVTDLRIEPTTFLVELGEDVSFRAFARLPTGSEIEVTAASGTSWTTTPPGALQDRLNGRFTAAGESQGVSVTVRYQGLSATATGSVFDPTDAVTDLRIIPNPIQLATGEQTAIVVIATLLSGLTLEVTSDPQIVYSVSDTQVGLIDPQGVISARGIGIATITANYRGVRATAQLDVLEPDAQLIQIFFSPDSINVPVNTLSSMSLQGFYSDGSIVDITTLPTVTYQPQNPAVATIRNRSQVFGQSGGTTSVIATESTSRLQATLNVSVLGTATVDSLIVTPNPLELTLGDTQQLSVFALFTDNALRSVTGDPGTTYTVTNTAIATVTAGGLLTTRATGTTQLTVRYGGVSTVVPINVETAISPITRIDVTVTPSSVDVGATAQLKVTGTRTSGSTIDLTLDPSVIYDYDPALISVSVSGQVATFAAGVATITASYNGLSDSVGLTIRAREKVLVGLQAQPSPVSLRLGGSAPLTITAFYDDGSSVDVTTDSATKVVSLNAQVVSVSGNRTLTAVAAGSATVQVTYRNLATSVAVRVLADTIRSLAVTPSPVTTNVGGKQQLKVIATTALGAQLDVTLASAGTTYRATVSGVIGISADGLITALAPGSINLTVTNGGVSATVPVTVNPRVLSRIEISPRDVTLTLQFDIGYPLQVYGIYSDGLQQLLPGTAGVVWRSTNTQVVAVDTAGFVTPINGGSAQVTARVGSLSDAISVSVDSGLPQQIVIEPRQTVLEIGGTQQLRVIAIYPSGNRLDITDLDTPFGRVTFTSGEPNVANATPSGLVTARGPGSATITASLAGLLSTSATVDVLAASPKQLVVLPSPATVQAGQSIALFAFLEYTDGRRLNVTTDPQTKFTSADPNTLRPAGGGTFFGGATGATEVKVEYGGFSTTIAVTVSP